MKNIYQMFEESYKKNPTRPYVMDKEMWTYQRTYQAIQNAIKMLCEKEIGCNDKVVLFMDNCIEYIVMYFALLYRGVTVIPVSTTCTHEYLINIIEDSQPKQIFTVRESLNKICKYELNGLCPVESIDQDIFEEYSASEFPQMRNGDVALVIYTSGTTNKPKGVMLTHGNLISNTESILAYLNLDESDSILAVLSFAYSYGNSVLLTHTRVGGMLYIYKAVYPIKVLEMIKEKKITGFSTVGSYLNILLKQKEIIVGAFEHMRYITLAGEQTSKENLEKLHELYKKMKIFVMYGQTEASARLTYLEPERLIEKIGSVGKPIKNVEIEIVDDFGNILPCDCEGEIIVKGENVMKGYLNNPEATAEVIKKNWLFTGDIGHKDSEGYLYITGRKREIIKHLGYRISPLEIENSINLNKQILESAVTEIMREGESEIIAAVVLENSSNNFDVRILYHDLKERLARYKLPKCIFVVKEIPKTVNGKIKRKDLQQLFWNAKVEEIYERDF